MPNFVTPSSTHAPALSSADPVDRAVHPATTEQLGYFARREVKRHQEREVVSQAKGRISEERRQAEQVATLALQARGAIARAEIGRVTGESLAAVAGAAYESHKAITGVQGEGSSERETTQSPEGEQDAARSSQKKYTEFRKQMEEVIDSEPLPLGHRETVRKYFESIRPANGDVTE